MNKSSDDKENWMVEVYLDAKLERGILEARNDLYHALSALSESLPSDAAMLAQRKEPGALIVQMRKALKKARGET